MILSNVLFESPMVFEENRINVLVVENRRELARFVTGMKSQVEGKDGSFFLSDGFDQISISDNVDLVIDPFSVNVNERDVLNKLYSRMKKEAYDEDNYLAVCNMFAGIESVIQRISEQQPFSLTFSENLDLAGLFKLMNIRFDLDSDVLLENICDYIAVSREYLRTRLFIFVNLKCFLSDEDIEDFYKFIGYNKIDILLIESTIRSSNPLEKIKIIDEDLCEINQNGETVINT